jgi:hypothetical protein
MTIGILINAAFFMFMGVSALFSPKFVVSFVKFTPETTDARNEVRAVYGGFGVAVSILLIYAAYSPSLKNGILLAVAVSLLGMAAGRIVSSLIERPGHWPIIFIFMESALATLLLFNIKW